MAKNEKKLQCENDRLRTEVAMLRARRPAPSIYFPVQLPPELSCSNVHPENVDHIAFFAYGDHYYAVVQFGTSTCGSFGWFGRLETGIWPIEFNAGQAG